MEYVTGRQEKTCADLGEFLRAPQGEEIYLEGAVHRIRDMGEMAFVILRSREGLIQTVWEGELLKELEENAV